MAVMAGMALRRRRVHVIILLLLSFAAIDAFQSTIQLKGFIRRHFRGQVLLRQAAADPPDGSYNLAAPTFDVLSLRNFRRDTLIQYDSTNQVLLSNVIV